MAIVALLVFSACEKNGKPPATEEPDDAPSENTPPEGDESGTSGSENENNGESEEGEKPEETPVSPPSDPSDPYENDKHWDLP